MKVTFASGWNFFILFLDLIRPSAAANLFLNQASTFKTSRHDLEKNDALEEIELLRKQIVHLAKELDEMNKKKIYLDQHCKEMWPRLEKYKSKLTETAGNDRL